MYLVHNRSDFLSKFLTLFFHHLCFSENGKSLHVLNLEGCRGLVLDRHQFNRNLASYQVTNYQPIQPIIRKCTELLEVNFGSTGLSYNSISFLADNLTKKVTKRLFGQKLHFCSSDAAILWVPKK